VQPAPCIRTVRDTCVLPCFRHASRVRPELESLALELGFTLSTGGEKLKEAMQARMRWVMSSCVSTIFSAVVGSPAAIASLPLEAFLPRNSCIALATRFAFDSDAADVYNSNAFIEGLWNHKGYAL
jgi:hypothetical protein